MNKLQTVEVPTTMDMDFNKEHTTWLNGKCVRLEEEDYITYYANHKNKERTEFTPEGPLSKVICTAVMLRVPKILDRTAPLRQDKEVFEELLPVFGKDFFELFKMEKMAALYDYDRSTDDGINAFFVDDLRMWLTKEERMVVENRFRREQKQGLKESPIFFKGMELRVPPAEGLKMLDAVNQYADHCFDNTQKHLAAINRMTTAEEIENYDITAGYPAFLHFTFNQDGLSIL